MRKSVVAVRELKAKLSGYLAKVRQGTVIEITSHGESIARIVSTSRKVKSVPQDLVKEGFASWNGKRVPTNAPTLRLKAPHLASDLILENRD